MSRLKNVRPNSDNLQSRPSVFSTPSPIQNPMKDPIKDPMKEWFQVEYRLCEESFDRVMKILSKAGNLLTGNNESMDSVGYTHNTTCAIIPHGGFGLLKAVDWSMDWILGLDNDILEHLMPYDVDILMFCDTCVSDRSEDDGNGDVLECDDLAAMLVVLVNSIGGEHLISARRGDSYSQIIIDYKKQVDVMIVKAAIGGLSSEYNDKVKQLNLEKTIRAYLDFPEDDIETSTRFLRIKVRAALAHEVSKGRNAEEIIKYMNKSKQELLDVSKNLEVVLDNVSEFTTKIERIELDELNTKRNITLALNAIAKEDSQALVNILLQIGKETNGSNKFEMLMNVVTRRHRRLSEYLFIYKCLAESRNLTKYVNEWEVLSYMKDLAFVIRLYQGEKRRIPSYEELKDVLDLIGEKTETNTLPRPTRIYMDLHGRLTAPASPDDPIDPENNISLNLPSKFPLENLKYFITGVPGRLCYSAPVQTITLEDAFNEMPATTKFEESLPLSILYSVDRNEQGRVIEFHTEETRIEDIADIYILSSLLFYGKKYHFNPDIVTDLHFKEFSSSDIIENLGKFNVFEKVQSINSHSCLGYSDLYSEEYYNKDSQDLRILNKYNQGGANMSASLLGIFLIAVASLVPR